MIKIGEFAKLGCVSVKALRHYDHLELLKPAKVDIYTGYRYYELDQLQRLNEILLFKLMGFSLDKVARLIQRSTADEVTAMLTSQESQLRAQQDEVRQRLTWLRAMRGTLLNEAGPFQIILKQQPEMKLTVIEDRVMQDGRQVHQQAIERLCRQLDTLMPEGMKFGDAPFWLASECGEDEPDTDFQCVQVGLPFTMKNAPQPLRQRILPAREEVLSLLYDPDTVQSEEARLALYEWTQRSGYHFEGPFYELHLQDRETILIELQREVSRSLPPQPIQVKKGENTMDVQIKHVEAQLFVGETRRFKPETIPQIAVFWGEFNVEQYPRIKDMVADEFCLGICSAMEGEDRSFNYAVAWPLKETTVKNVPEGLEVIMLPAQDYLVVPAPGAKDNIGKAYDYAFSTWLPQNAEWEHDAMKPDFEYYDEDFNDFKEDSLLWVYIPIRKKG
ncbi:MAG: GyrI-like domain-containing protein [Anaerolineae bacterium]|jgi:predicted transcriptional regulator YdeE/DNA-binding transcriptional MerR regulator|nr:GyrI-like domain-containing protein [Anaerolineae bacterium]